MAKLEITYIRNANGRPWRHGLTVQALGFHRLHETRILPDNPAIRGMIAKIPHLLSWRIVEEGANAK
jgi:large subunit ribosomal protein L30